jgi:hypothetical protein
MFTSENQNIGQQLCIYLHIDLSPLQISTPAWREASTKLKRAVGELHRTATVVSTDLSFSRQTSFTNTYGRPQIRKHYQYLRGRLDSTTFTTRNLGACFDFFS